MDNFLKVQSKKYLSVISSFIIMLCIGSIYTWSIFADELIKKYNWYSYQTQLVFGMVIVIFPITMLILRNFRHVHIKLLLFISSTILDRIIWVSIFNTLLVIFFALLMQSVSISSFIFIPVNNLLFVFISALIGFSLGGNFVLFAKETTSKSGSENLSYYYPLILLGYAVTGIVGPFIGGILFDIYNNYNYSIAVASIVSFIGSMLFLNIHNIKR